MPQKSIVVVSLQVFKRHRSIVLAASEYDVSLSLPVCNDHIPSPVIGRCGS